MNEVRVSHAWSLLWRGLVVGIGYMLAIVGSGMLAGILGMALPSADNVGSSMVWMFLSSIVIGVTLGAVAQQVHTSRQRHVVIWSSVLFFNVASVIIEGSFFTQAIMAALPAVVLQQFVAAVVVGLLVTYLFTSTEDRPLAVSASSRPWHSWLWRFVASSFSYLLFYWIFGALNFMFVTHSYYETIPDLVIPAPEVVLLAESIRAPLIVLSLLPLLLYWHVPVRRRAVVCGALLFVIGGVVPLLWQAGTLPLFLLVASGWEILAQNGLTGVVVAWLLGMPAVRRVALRPVAA